MKASTHIGFAELVYLVLLTTSGVRLGPLNAAAVAVSSVLPDIDSGASRIGGVVPVLTRYIERRVGHRTLTHSLPFIAFLSLLLLVPLLEGFDVAACIIAGYASHSLLDTCTPNGVRLFYPFSGVRCVFPFDGNSPHRFRVDTSSKLDRAIGILFFAACIPALYVAGQGYERFIRVTQHSIESAVRDYEVYARSASVFADIEAYDQMSGEPLRGRFRVVGALNAHAIVFLGPDHHLHTAGKEFESDFVAENIVCFRGGPVRTAVRTVELRGEFLGGLLAVGDTSSESYLFGEVVTAEDVLVPGRLRAFSPVTGAGRRLRLNYARPEDLRELNLDGMLAAAGTLTIKTVTGEGSPAADLLPESPPASGSVLSFVVRTGESVEFRKRTGDTVRAGEILAVRSIPAPLDEQKALNEENRRMGETRERELLPDLDRAIDEARLAAGSDSLECAAARELASRGFASPAALSGAELKWERAKRAIGKLLGSRKLVAARAVLEAAHFSLAEAQLREKRALHAQRSEFRSSFAGIILDIRREPFNGKEKIVFLVRRIPS